MAGGADQGRAIEVIKINGIAFVAQVVSGVSGKDLPALVDDHKGRIGSGAIELLAAILILVPKTVPYGAILSFGTMTGAIFSHFTTLGIVIDDDGGALFGMAVLVFISSGGLGTMGFGLPAAIGVQVAKPDATVIDFDGDHSFNMTMTELSTAVEHNLPIKVCILNNGYMGMVRQWQELFYGKRYSKS